MNIEDILKSRFCNKNGILCREQSIIDTAFSAEQQDDLFSIEDDSWWFNYRANCLISLIKKFVKGSCVYDIGGGNGFTAAKIQQETALKCVIVEPCYQACIHAKSRGIESIINTTVNDENFFDNSLENVLLLDVLEHIESDRNFLYSLQRKMCRTGILVLTVPAFNCLWSSEDDSAGHFRRYRINDLKVMVEDSGFKILFCSYFFLFLFLPILFVRVLMENIGLLKKRDERTREEQNNINKTQFKNKKGIIRLILKSFERLECFILNKGFSLPFGSSIVIIGKKTDS